MAPMANYLLVRTLDALDLHAAEAAMAENDFEVRLERSDSPPALKVIWQPDPVVHPQHPSGGILDTPPVEVHELRFDAGETAARIRRDIANLLAEEGQHAPHVLMREGLVHLQEIEGAESRKHTTAMLYALLCELAATAAAPDDVVIFDPENTICIDPSGVRELMNWRDMLYLLEHPLFLEEPAREAPQSGAEPAEEGARNGYPDRSSTTRLSPGQQPSSTSWVWLAACIAALAGAAWYWVQR